MWNDTLVTKKPEPKKPPAKPKPAAKKKPKPKPRPKSTNKLEKDVAALKELTRNQGIMIKRLGEIVTNFQLGNVDKAAVDT